MLKHNDITVTDLVACSFVCHVQSFTIFAIYPRSIVCLPLWFFFPEQPEKCLHSHRSAAAQQHSLMKKDRSLSSPQ